MEWTTPGVLEYADRTVLRGSRHIQHSVRLHLDQTGSPNAQPVVRVVELQLSNEQTERHNHPDEPETSESRK
jgi:hypothetical protein